MSGLPPGLPSSLPQELSLVRLAADYPAWGAVLDLIRASFGYMNGVIDPPSSALALTPESLAARAAGEIAIGLFSRDRPVACVFLEPQPDCLYVGKLAVDPQMHGNGLGSYLLAEAERIAARRGLAWLVLQTRIELKANHAFFAARGFVKSGQGSHAGYCRPTWVVMRKPVKPR